MKTLPRFVVTDDYAIRKRGRILHHHYIHEPCIAAHGKEGAMEEVIQRIREAWDRMDVDAIDSAHVILAFDRGEAEG